MTIPFPSTTTKKPKSRGDKVTHRVEQSGQVVAGGVGSAFGAAKLRDEYVKDPKTGGAKALHRKVGHLQRVATQRGVSPAHAKSLARVVEHGKPQFKPLVALVGAGAVATGAHRAQSLSHYFQEKRAGVSKSRLPTGDYKPANQLSPGQRGAVARAAQGRTSARRRLAPTPFTQIARIPASPPRHAAKPYMGTRRKPSFTDKVRMQALIHSKKINTLNEQAVDLFKHGRLAPGETLTAVHLEKGRSMTITAFDVEHVGISKESPRTKAETRDRKNRVQGGATAGVAIGGYSGVRRGARLQQIATGPVTRSALRTASAVGHGGVRAGVGAVAGATAAGTVHGQHLRAKHSRADEVAKSAFGVEHISKRPMPGPGLVAPEGYKRPKTLRSKVPTSDPLNLGRTYNPGRAVHGRAAVAGVVAATGAAGTGALIHHHQVSKISAGDVSALATRNGARLRRVVANPTKNFRGGFHRGVETGRSGHSPMGQIGSGRAGRPTYSLEGGSRGGRAGTHAGVLASNAPLIGASAAAGGAAGAGGVAASKRRGVSKSAFGVEHVNKGAHSMRPMPGPGGTQTASGVLPKHTPGYIDGQKLAAGANRAVGAVKGLGVKGAVGGALLGGGALVAAGMGGQKKKLTLTERTS